MDLVESFWHLVHALSFFNVRNSTFINNIAGDYGGVIATTQCSFNITECKFSNSSANASGRVIMAVGQGSFFNVRNSIFTNNIASYHGGVIYTDQCLFNITDCKFGNSSANASGGVIMAVGPGSFFNVRNSIFTNNIAASYHGGVIYTDQCSFNITDCKFSNSSANTCGGAIMAEGPGSFFNVRNSVFTNNTAASYDGGVIVTSQLMFIQYY